MVWAATKTRILRHELRLTVVDQQLGFGWDEPEGASSAEVALLPRAANLAARVRGLAERGIYLGTSSWKYPGWLGAFYNPLRYQTRGKHSKKKFNDASLAEYVEFMPTVCGDFAFYQFPSESAWRRLFEIVPGHFRMSLKIPEEITAFRYPEFPRYGRRAGLRNDHFMDAEMLQKLLLSRLEPYRDRLGVLVFQFGTIREPPFNEPKAFAERLASMLADLPTERFLFAVEVRNPDFLCAEYAESLRAHNVAHCFNSWTRMPPVTEQLAMTELRTAGHLAARFLLRPGRTYAQAVEQFEPYERMQDPYPEGRQALRQLIELSLNESRRLYAWVNNRLEGNALETITATLDDPAC